MMRSKALPASALPVLSVYPEQWTLSTPEITPLSKTDLSGYRAAAEWVNASDIDVVSLQHEFGIFGGEAGEYILHFLDALKKPVVTTFHTVFPEETLPYTPVQREILKRSLRVVVMNRLGIDWLKKLFDVDESLINYLPHGAPEPLHVDPAHLRRKWQLQKRKVLLTFGLLSPGKGIDQFLDILSMIVPYVPDVLYVIAGLTHPEVKKREGEAYRQQLQERIESLHLNDHVRFINRFFSEEELTELLTVTDLYISPYPGMTQITSGTLAYAVGLGRPIVTTPYAYARDVLRDFPDLIIPYGAKQQWAEKIIKLLTDQEVHRSIEQRMQLLGRTMRWPYVGRLFFTMLQKLMNDRGALIRHG